MLMMKKYTFRTFSLLLFLVAFIGTIIYLGSRTIEHEALLRHYQQQRLAQSNVDKIQQFTQQLLNETTSELHLESLQVFPSLESLIEHFNRDNLQDARFIIQSGTLRYPETRRNLSDSTKGWIELLTPILRDPGILSSHYVTDEQSRATSGWFVLQETERPTLVYWRYHNDYLIGYRISYVELLSSFINRMDEHFAPDAFSVEESGRLLYQSGDNKLFSPKHLTVSQRLPYPLINWQINYYSASASTTALYLWGAFFILLSVLLVLTIVLRLYREHKSQIRQAQQKVHFVSQVSHELKTPLTNISLYAEMLKEEAIHDEHNDTRYLDVIISESQRLSRLIQNILSFTKTPRIHWQSVDINQQLALIYQTFQPAFQAKAVTFTFSAPDTIIITTDVDRFTQIISNFLSNAEKYASHGKRVEMSSKREKDSVYISIRDYGDGIPAKERKLIFTPFYRIKSTLTEGVSGTGIGLTIAKQLAVSLKGEILVENCIPGVCFTLKLPLQMDIRENSS